MKAMAVGMAALGLALSVASKASATAISSNNAAALVVRLTPSADRGVSISSGDVNLNLGNIELGATAYTLNPATVTIQGTITNTELDLAGLISGGWVFDNNQTYTSTGTNLLNAWVAFTSVSFATAPVQEQGGEYFGVSATTGAKLTSGTPSFNATAVGVSAGTGKGRFEADDPAADMDGMSPGIQRHFWTYFRLPPTTSFSSEQSINFVLSTRAGP